MRLSIGQKTGLHAAARQAGLNEDQYRLVLRRLAGVDSAADPKWRRRDFIACMAFFEAKAGGRLRGNTAGYWRDELRAARPGDALRHRVRREARRLGWTDADLNRFLASRRCSSGRFACIEDAPPEWLVRLLEALKAMAERREIEERRE